MCGRYTIAKPERIVVTFSPETVSTDLSRPRYNIAPTQQVPVVAVTGGRRVMMDCRWGLVPHWAQDAAIGNRMINARADSVAVKPAFRTSFRHARCLVPADGFYEWRKTAAGKEPFYITVGDGESFAFAGLYAMWNGTGTGALLSCAIVTTDANDAMRQIHDRMPAILPETDWRQWLDPNSKDAEALVRMLRPFDGEKMKMRRVSKLVNSPANDDERCIAELTSPQSPQPS